MSWLNIKTSKLSSSVTVPPPGTAGNLCRFSVLYMDTQQHLLQPTLSHLPQSSPWHFCAPRQHHTPADWLGWQGPL